MRRLIPDTLFTRLFLLLLVTLTASHFLGMAVVFNLELSEPPPPASAFAPSGPSSRLPPLPEWLSRPPPVDFPPPKDNFGWRVPGQEPAPTPTVTPLPGDAPGTRLPLPYRPHGGWISAAMRLIALGLTAWIGARWLSRPINRIAQAAEHFGDSLSTQPLEESGPAEARQAARALNRMQAQLLEQIRQRSQFLAAVSHDLRTPITRLNLRVEGVEPPELREKLHEDLREMSIMLGSTLDYLRGHVEPEPLQPLDVEALVNSLAEDAQDQGQQVSVNGKAKPIMARPVALRRCLDNLIGNALRYGQSAEITLKDTPGTLIIEVRDHGPGIPEDHLEAVFAPFVRLETSRNRASGGTGLGLSIARDVALSHGGRLTLRNCPEGGLIARLNLPRK
ncbi:two-component system, OmpR family, osmolarity sensor histidine kinase EnvZ [Methylococcus capsulatus]|uniref:histidine kinase n=1 Tax=Methylococcus capsulatus TaxID=414 RepID=A0AA35USS2_METCP|nr:ATP-binding protein [Methylococcus capsulatus]CAI8747276.1 two-component system, OmpR family, osmolarity sensor histidine kinase EnvZ [Methylococcus capsulatus]